MRQCTRAFVGLRQLRYKLYENHVIKLSKIVKLLNLHDSELIEDTLSPAEQCDLTHKSF